MTRISILSDNRTPTENESEEERTIKTKTSRTGEAEQGSLVSGPDHNVDELACVLSEDLANGSGEPPQNSEEQPQNSKEAVHVSERGSGNASEPGAVETDSVEEGQKDDVVLVEKKDGVVEVIEQDQEFLKNAAVSKKESPPLGKDSKKNAKKGKSKGKEDCKMS